MRAACGRILCGRISLLMRIALVSFLWDRLGGAAAVPQRLAAELARRGHDVTVITSQRDHGLAVNTEQGVTVYRFRPTNLYWVGDKDRHGVSLRAIWQLVDSWNPDVYRVVTKILRAVRPDVVHVHKLRGLSPSVWQAARRAGAGAIVQTCHDYELISPHGALEGRIGAFSRDGHPLLRPYQALRARASRAVDLVTAPSRYLLDTLRRRGMFPATEARVIPNFHDVSADDMEEPGPLRNEADGCLRLMYLGRLEPNKGILMLLQALDLVKDDFQLFVAGWGSAAAAVRRAAQRDRRIQWLGKVEGEEKDGFLAAADAVIVPSLSEETFGVVVVEAHARGTPVIASRMGALPSLVQEGKTGWLFDLEERFALADCVRRVLRRPEELAAMRPACLEAAREYTLECVIPRYLAAYDAALGVARRDGRHPLGSGP